MKQNKKSILCKDNSRECKDLVKKGLCKTDSNIANNLCRKSCNACEPNNVKYFLDHINTNAKKCRIEQLGKVYGEIEDEDIVRSKKYKNLMNSNNLTTEGKVSDVLRKRLKKLEKIRLSNLKGLDCEYDKESKEFNNRRYKKYLVHQKKNEYRQNILSDKYHKNLLLRTDPPPQKKKVVSDSQCLNNNITPVVNKPKNNNFKEKNKSDVINNKKKSDNLNKNDMIKNKKKSVKKSIIDLNNKEYLKTKEEDNIYDKYNIDLSLFNQEEEKVDEEEEENLIDEEDEMIDEETYFQVDNKISKNTYFDYNKQLKIIDNLKYKKPYRYYFIKNQVGFQEIDDKQIEEEYIDEEIINEELDNFDEEAVYYNNNVLDKKKITNDKKIRKKKKSVKDKSVKDESVKDESVKDKSVKDESVKFKLLKDFENNIQEEGEIIDEEVINDEEVVYDEEVINDEEVVYDEEVIDDEVKKLREDKVQKEFNFSDLKKNKDVKKKTKDKILINIEYENDDNKVGFTFNKLFDVCILLLIIYIIYKLFVNKYLFE